MQLGQRQPAPQRSWGSISQPSNWSWLAAGIQASHSNKATLAKVKQFWELPGADDLFEAVLNAMVRAAATLKAPRPEALKAIRESVCESVAEYAGAGVHRVPMPAVLATAAKPQSASQHQATGPSAAPVEVAPAPPVLVQAGTLVRLLAFS